MEIQRSCDGITKEIIYKYEVPILVYEYLHGISSPESELHEILTAEVNILSLNLDF